MSSGILRGSTGSPHLWAFLPSSFHTPLFGSLAARKTRLNNAFHRFIAAQRELISAKHEMMALTRVFLASFRNHSS
jgi:hypothetical protein